MFDITKYPDGRAFIRVWTTEPPLMDFLHTSRTGQFHIDNWFIFRDLAEGQEFTKRFYYLVDRVLYEGFRICSYTAFRGLPE